MHVVFYHNWYAIILSISLIPMGILIFLHEGDKVGYGEDFTSLFYNITNSHNGLSFQNLMTKYWDWWINVPAKPGIPTSGCVMKDIGNVLFLIDPLFIGKTVAYSCNIPEGKALFFPLVMSEVDPKVPEYKGLNMTDTMMLAKAREENEGNSFKLVIDGRTIPESYLKSLRTNSPFWNITVLDKDNQYEAEVGSYRAVTEGNYVFLKPLSPGWHELHYEASSLRDNPTAELSTGGIITYKIFVNSSAT